MNREENGEQGRNVVDLLGREVRELSSPSAFRADCPNPQYSNTHITSLLLIRPISILNCSLLLPSSNIQKVSWCQSVVRSPPGSANLFPLPKPIASPYLSKTGQAYPSLPPHKKLTNSGGENHEKLGDLLNFLPSYHRSRNLKGTSWSQPRWAGRHWQT